MNSISRTNVRAGSRARAWVRAIVVTVCLVVLIQLGLFVANRFLPRGANPRSVVISEITAIALAELIVVFALRKFLSKESRTLRSLGLWQSATLWSWILGIGLGLLTAIWGLSNPALHLSSKLAALFDLSPWHIYSAFAAGIAAGFCEEIVFRGFVMQELAAAGHAAWVQVVGSAFLFGAAHAGLLHAGLKAGLLVTVPTAFLGALYALIYLAGRRSLMPIMVSHFLNDFAVIPWVFLLVATKLGH